VRTTYQPEPVGRDIIVGLRVVARTACTRCKEEEFTAWKVHSHPITQVDVARGLDRAAAVAVERRGKGALRAGAKLLATIAGGGIADRPDEAIESLAHPLARILPVGDVQSLRWEIASARKRLIWNGHDYIIVPAKNCQALLRDIHCKAAVRRIRARRSLYSGANPR